jgi:hypothetical protein
VLLKGGYMKRGDYRQELKNMVADNECMDEKTEYIELNYAIDIINRIESDVNEIRDKLSPYRSLTEINDIYELADMLSDKLY